MLRASDEATSGSVIANPERISPSSSGVSHRSFCSGVPNSMRVSMLPVSGAPQLVASGARVGRRPHRGGGLGRSGRGPGPELGDGGVLQVGAPALVVGEQVPGAPLAGLGL